MDNWFSSPKLMNDLRNRGTYATGTVIARRKGLPASFKTARLPKGSVVVKSQRDLLAILYVDRRNVTFLTTSENARTVRKVNSKGRVVSAPSVVHKYNQTMGGVDLGDQLLLKFEPQFKGVKLWRKILFNLLTTATVNAYICYRNCFLVQRKLDHVKFQNAVVRGLIGDFRGGNRRRGRRPDNIPIANAIRMHFLDVIPDGKRRKCVKCSGDDWMLVNVRGANFMDMSLIYIVFDIKDTKRRPPLYLRNGDLERKSSSPLCWCRTWSSGRLTPELHDLQILDHNLVPNREPIGHGGLLPPQLNFDGARPH
ncbi:Hypothetical predicted protein [Mytilus galloprovincialis]|uniref:PiggyBac transposable element-derived protein domain-containing protein n=1 Tax=Mytilus galloprovincialis TaxID=29158 RepID=A0A8B6C804_MYTGA|nr:Hypothetical predicted protein [Mytilus galloprovincialis]